ncbi:MAG: RNA polymerase sigma-70 factor [Mediterranea sp.]|jgi:RNA polymerase sigma-70 factor (ECF subfamily)|nr:RNA polymerase sigma-70 factor [Mediterranea sp.]
MIQLQDKESLTECFRKIYDEYYPTAKRFAAMLLKSDEDAHDIVHDLFARLWEQPQTWMENEELSSFIYTSTRNAVLNFIKHKRVEAKYQEKMVADSVIDQLFSSDNPLRHIYYEEIVLIVKLMVEHFPRKRKAIFVMSRVRGMSNQEIADTMSISIRTVEHHLFLALREIKQVLFVLLGILCLLSRSSCCPTMTQTLMRFLSGS